MERNLEVKLVYSNGWVDVQIYEPESGDYIGKEFNTNDYSYLNCNPEFDQFVSTELYAWVEMMKEEESELKGESENGI